MISNSLKVIIAISTIAIILSIALAYTISLYSSKSQELKDEKARYEILVSGLVASIDKQNESILEANRQYLEIGNSVNIALEEYDAKWKELDSKTASEVSRLRKLFPSSKPCEEKVLTFREELLNLKR